MDLERQNSSPAGNCRFAIPKKGRLFEKVVEMLKGAGIEFRREPRLDVALCVDLPITLVFLPAADIAKYVGEGNVDLGITGIDVVQESMVEVNHIMDLGFGKCKLCVQAPVTSKIKDAEDLAGKRIVTSFPDISRKFFDPMDAKKGVQTSVKFVSGSVEAACSLGLADAVVDLVETGTTMKVRRGTLIILFWHRGTLISSYRFLPFQGGWSRSRCRYSLHAGHFDCESERGAPRVG
jgi:ATP phosphoribosyltransferase